jgi:hypothetical protein
MGCTRNDPNRTSLFILGEVVEDGNSLINLVLHRVAVLEQMQEFRVVHLEQHSGDLSSEVGLETNGSGIGQQSKLKEDDLHSLEDLHIDDFAKHLLLLHG